MSLQQSAVRLPEGGDEWALDPAIEQNQEPLDQTNDDTNAVETAPTNALNQQPEPPALTDLDRVAMGLGWTPQSEWRGDPSKWTPAADYIRNTGRVLERTKNDLKLTRKQIDEQNARLARVEQGQQSIANQRAQEVFEQYEDAKFEAAKAGDTELYRKLTKEQQDVMAKVKPTAPAPQHASEVDVYSQAEAIMSDPVAARFFEANPIALQDEQAWALMDREMTRVAASGGSPAAQFKAAEETLRYAYADAYERHAFNGNIPNNTQTQQQHHSQQQPRAQDGTFANPQQQQPPRRPAPPMNAASRVSQPAEKTAVDRLPAEARAFLNKEIAAGRVKAEESEEWAQYFHGGPVVVRGRAMNGAKA